MTDKSKTEPPVWALGMMSGTSLDGIDAALVLTDGERVFAHGQDLTQPYSEAERAQLFACIEGGGGEEAAAKMLALRHAEVAKALLAQAGMQASEVALIGFHGQTVLHDPAHRITRQIGDAALLARETGIEVVADFRSADVAAGGQGAPLVPLYHAALTDDAPKPLAVLNIGGVANVTYIGEGEASLLAFDTGPGNALMDDWVRAHTGASYDAGGALAASGRADEGALAQLLAHPYFTSAPPKSLDRNAFRALAMAAVSALSPADGVATLLALTVRSIARARQHFPQPVTEWLVTGGGRHNAALMAALRAELGAVRSVEALGWKGDALEAEAFAFLAVRSVRGLPLSLPGTTGVPFPLTGGRRFAAA